MCGEERLVFSTMMAGRGKQGISKYFYDIAEEVPADKWKDFARKLKLQEVKIGRIDVQERGVVKECCMKVLHTWRMSNGKKATLDVLRKALDDAELGVIAENIKDDEPECRRPVQDKGSTSGVQQTSVTTFQYSQPSMGAKASVSAPQYSQPNMGAQPENMDCEDYDDSILEL